PAPPLVRRRLRGDLGWRAHRTNGLRGHEEAARRSDHRPLRTGPRALPRAHGAPGRGRRDPRGGRRSPAADGRGHDGRGPPEDGAAVVPAEPAVGRCRRPTEWAWAVGGARRPTEWAGPSAGAVGRPSGLGRRLVPPVSPIDRVTGVNP